MRFLTVLFLLSLNVLGKNPSPGGAGGSGAITQPPVQPTIVAPIPTTVLTTGLPGVYEYLQYDKSKIQDKILTEVFKRNDEDYRYFQATVRDIEKEFKKFVDVAIYDKETGLAGISQTYAFGKDKFMPADEFLAAINRFNSQKLALLTKIKTLTAIGEGVLPSSIKLDEKSGAGLSEVKNYGTENFKDIISFYNARVEELEKYVKNLPHRIMLPDGVPFFINANEGKGLMLESDKIRVSPEKVNEWRKEMNALYRWDQEQEDTLVEFSKLVRDRMIKFLQTYRNRWRMMSAEEKEQRAKEAKWIADAFWLRSYLRASYGLPIGAIGVADYNKIPLHLDNFLVSTNALTNFREDIIFDENQLMRQVDNYKQILKRLNVRSAEILNGDLSLIANAENLITWLAGNKNLAEAQLMMIQILAADCYEERLVMQGTLIETVARYRSRYMNSLENEIHHVKLQWVYDPDSLTEDDIKKRFEANPEAVKQILGEDKDAAFRRGFRTADKRTLQGMAQVLFTEVMKKKEDQLDKAERLKAAIANATNPNNKFAVDSGKRKKGL